MAKRGRDTCPPQGPGSEEGGEVSLQLVGGAVWHSFSLPWCGVLFQQHSRAKHSSP